MPTSRQRLGRLGEEAAGRYLEARGYRIVARNVRADRVEIDLVARRGERLVFVEVKTRRGERQGSGEAAVDARKQARLRRGARAWLATRPAEARGIAGVRFDVIVCRPAPADASEPVAGWRIRHWAGGF